MALLTVRVTPKGGRDDVDGWARDESGRLVLKVRVSAAPSDGAANTSVITLLAKRLGVAKSHVRIVSGETSRTKRLELTRIDEAALRQAFGEADG